MHAAGDPVAGEAKAAACAGCHGADGNSVNPIWPNLAGQGADYIAKQVMDFKAGARQDPLMSGMAMAVQDADLPDVAAFYASKALNPVTPEKPELVEQGQAIYEAGIAAKGVTACAACHGPNANGNLPAKFPALRSQHAAYTIKQLQAFRDGARANDPNQMMRGVAALLSEQEIEALAMYLATQH
ncbi:MAG TPA: c-type cytochrome [Gammaproteobacteria bacterium]